MMKVRGKEKKEFKMGDLIRFYLWYKITAVFIQSP